jgi:hypothetical protein
MKLNRVMRVLALFLISALLSNNLAFAVKRPIDPDAMKAKITARGLGQGVRVKLTDKTEVKGVILSMDDKTFVLKIKDVDQPRSIDYVQVTDVRNAKLSTGAKVGIGLGVLGIGIGVTVAVFAYLFTHL